MFAQDSPQVVAKQGPLSILTSGDLMLGNQLIPVIQSRGVDYPFDSVACVIREADIAVVNLEAPFTEGGIPYPKKFTFAVPPAFAQGPIRAGFDVFTLANNHILDYGTDGLVSTINTLKTAGVSFCGAGMDRAEAIRPTILTQKGIQVALLAFSLTFPDSFWATSRRAGTAYVGLSALKNTVREAQQLADVVVVSFHWGGELLDHPKPYQIQYGHQAIDAGADLVVGHHPHVLQGVEVYRGRVIAYSLGNFAFGSYSDKVQYGALLKADFSPQGLIRAEILPISVNNYRIQFQPRILRSFERDKALYYFNMLSKNLNHGREMISQDGRIRIHPD